MTHKLKRIYPLQVKTKEPQNVYPNQIFFFFIQNLKIKIFTSHLYSDTLLYYLEFTYIYFWVIYCMVLYMTHGVYSTK